MGNLSILRGALASAQVSTYTTGSITLPSARTAFVPTGDFEAIASSTVATATNSISFTSIPQTFKHLQVRMVGFSSTGNYPYISSNLTRGRRHLFYHAPSTILSTGTGDAIGLELNIGGMTGVFALIVDIADYSSTNKLKQFKAHLGNDRNGSGQQVFSMGYWTEASTALNSLTFTMSASDTFSQHSNIALYGIRG